MWTEENLATLRELWGTMPAWKIGEIIFGDITKKNSIIGKAHRIGLGAGLKHTSGKPFFSKTDQPRTPKPKVQRAGVVTLPALASIRPVHTEVRETSAVVIPFAPRKPAPLKPPPLLSKQPCCWPLGDPKSTTFRFCGEHTKLGKPYCPTHCDAAYIKVRDRREDDVMDRLRITAKLGVAG
jgi:GcrA cell cycle regulator